MTKEELTERVDALITETHDALQTVHDNLNKGQRQKLIKNEKIKTLFDRYGVEYESEV